MRPLIKTCCWVMLLCSGTLLARAQAPVTVQLETNLPEAIVYADSVRLGAAYQQPFLVPASTRQLQLVAGRSDSWSVPPVRVPLEAAPGDTLMLQADFPYYYRVESVPYGAEVYQETASGRQLLGTTPLLHEAAVPLAGTLVLERPTYAVQRVEPGQQLWNRHAVMLEPVQPPVLDDEAPTAEIVWQPPTKRLQWVDYAALGLAATAGALAVHYKFKADRRYDTYLRTTDPALRPVVERYDLRSGIALGAMQAGLGVFAVRLILR